MNIPFLEALIESLRPKQHMLAWAPLVGLDVHIQRTPKEGEGFRVNDIQGLCTEVAMVLGDVVITVDGRTHTLREDDAWEVRTITWPDDEEEAEEVPFRKDYLPQVFGTEPHLRVAGAQKVPEQRGPQPRLAIYDEISLLDDEADRSEAERLSADLENLMVLLATRDTELAKMSNRSPMYVPYTMETLVDAIGWHGPRLQRIVSLAKDNGLVSEVNWTVAGTLVRVGRQVEALMLTEVGRTFLEVTTPIEED